MSGGSTKDDEDEAELARMELSLLQNFGVSFSIISIITGIPSLFSYGLNTGACTTMLVGLAMAEICSAHPTSGGPYYWAAMLTKPESAPLASWITGWFNLLGQVAVTTGISFACANFLSTVAEFGTSFVPTPKTTIGIYAAVLISQGLINTFGVHLLKYLNNASIWWHSLGTTSVHQSANFVFRTFIDGTGVNGNEGWGTRASHAYVCRRLTTLLWAGPVGIIMALGVSAVLGWFLILGLLFSIQNLETTISSPTGEPVAQIFLDTVGEKGAIVLMIIVIGAMYFCGTFSVTSNSRMMFAFARDGGIPGHKFFRKVERSAGKSLWLACALSFCLALLDIATHRSLYSYAIRRGPFHLGAFSMPVAIGAVTWIGFIAIAFILPQANPVNSQTLNYSIVCVGIVVLYSVGFWLISARKWFSGPIRQISAEEMGVSKTLESEVSDVKRAKSS
ncbi:amino acid permease-domain-containing protein [Pisolithus microcarpus]|nr:amino acid permease-domain-containing protein [Pisolithus microcarpus]